MSESYFERGVSEQALDIVSRIGQLLGRGVVTGGEISEGARPFAVDIRDATAYLDGQELTLPATSVNLRKYTDVDAPRKVVIYIGLTDAGEGEYRVAAGEPAEPSPPDALRFETYEPAPPDLRNIVAAPVAEVWLGEYAQQVTDEDIRDRRLNADMLVHAATSERGRFDEIIDGAGTSHTGQLFGVGETWTDANIRASINADTNHGSTAYHDYFSGNHRDLSMIRPSQHHTRYTDAEAVAAITGAVDAADLAAGASTIPGEHLVIGDTGLEWQGPPRAEAPVIAQGTMTHTGGSSTTVRVEGVSTTEVMALGVSAHVDAAPAFAADYGYSVDVSRVWDGAGDEIDLDVTATWDIDPGTGNDLTLGYTVYQTDPHTAASLYDSTAVLEAVNGEAISPGGVLSDTRSQPPVYAATADAPAPSAGDVIIVDGSGTEGFGEWLYDGTAWQGPYASGLAGISDLTIDVAKDWAGYPIQNVGGSVGAGTGSTGASSFGEASFDGASFAGGADTTSELGVIRPRDITDHASVTAAHHEPTTGADIDHANITNVQPDQHHAPVTDGEVASAVAGVTMSIPIPATEIPDGRAVRTHAAVGSGEAFSLVRGEYYTEAGTTPTGVTLQIYDKTAGSVQYEQTTKLESGSADAPLALISGAADLELRIRNSSGSAVVAGGVVSAIRQ